MKNIFNYIITIHNKEDLIEDVLISVIKCCHDNSYIYPIIDGCTDKTEEIIDRVISQYPNNFITKVKLNDVHEILSINAGLKLANQSQDGYNIIIQDDVILEDNSIEYKVTKIYEKIGCKLGYLSFMLGANLKKDILSSNEGSPFIDYIESAYGFGMTKSKILLPGQLAFRSIAIKSPVCIPTKIIREFGLLDENLAPSLHDDTEYCIRLLKSGYKNAVFGIKYRSDIDWGATRRKLDITLNGRIISNMNYIRKLYYNDILNLIAHNQETDLINIDEFIDKDEHKIALKLLKSNRNKSHKFQMEGLSFYQKIKYYIKSKIKN